MSGTCRLGGGGLELQSGPVGGDHDGGGAVRRYIGSGAPGNILEVLVRPEDADRVDRVSRREVKRLRGSGRKQEFLFLDQVRPERGTVGAVQWIELGAFERGA
jgi:hypothetical protein